MYFLVFFTVREKNFPRAYYFLPRGPILSQVIHNLTKNSGSEFIAILHPHAFSYKGEVSYLGAESLHPEKRKQIDIIYTNILNYKKRGFRKIRVDNVIYEIDKVPELNKKIKHSISILVDRIVLNSELGNRLAESVETAVNLSNGLINIEYENETLPKKYRKIES